MQSIQHKLRAVGIAGIASLVLAACNVAGGSGAGGDLTISVAGPTDGAEVSVPFEVQIDSNVPLGPPESGNHHAHLYYDTDVNSADYDLVYGNTFEVTRDLQPGPHTIIASLRNADHSDAGPSQTFEITVVAGDGSSTPPSTSEDPNPDSLY